jgi:LPS sulfotransferase NodH
MIKFLIITQPRSGSAWFMSCLNSHPQIYSPGFPTIFSKYNLSPFKWFKPRFLQVDNPISPYYKYRSKTIKRQFAHRFNRKKLIFGFLSDLYSSNDNVEAVGFKINYSQLRKYTETFSWIKQNDVRIIQLVRNNLLKRLVSHKVANMRNLLRATQKVEPIKVHIDTGGLIEDFRRRQRRFAKYRKDFIDTLGVTYLEVSYESLFSGHDKELRRALQFLGIDNTISLTSDLVKVNPDSLEDIIENYREVEQALLNTEFKDFLY